MAKHVDEGAVSLPNNAAAPSLTQLASRVSFDGFPVPVPGEVYDYVVHGI